MGDLRNDNDPSCTYEGDNNVILQQTANYLLSFVESGTNRISSPMHTVDFLQNLNTILTSKYSSGQNLLDTVINAYKWLCCYLLQKSGQKIQQALQRGANAFTARNEAQVYHCHSLAIAFFEVSLDKNSEDHVPYESLS